MNRRNKARKVGTVLNFVRALFLTPAGGLVLLSVVVGCAPVQPYEREHLANPMMLMDQTTADGFDQHMYRSLEQGTGQPAGGGGCGCEQ